MAEALDLQLVRHALTVARRNGFAEVELGIGDDRFTARLEPAPPGRPAAPTASAGGASDESTEPQLQEIKSTLVGYYREAKTPLRVGETVKAGDVVAVIAALGIANDVESTVSGEVAEVLVEPNQPVQYGQTIARVKA